MDAVPSPPPEPQVHVFVGKDVTKPDRIPAARGEAVVWSQRSPDRGEAPNEDSAMIVTLPGGRAVLAVADGAGGHPNGADASRAAIRALAAAVRDTAPEQDLRGAILEGFDRANAAVTALGGAATTLAAVGLDGNRLRSYHAGDSSVVGFGQRGRIKHVTLEHSPTGYAVEAGLMSSEEALHHEDRHVVSNLLGYPEMKIEVGPQLELAARDTVVLGTDGLFDNVGVAEIVEQARKGPILAAVMRLGALCRTRMTEPREGDPSKPDDATFVVFRPTVGRR